MDRDQEIEDMAWAVQKEVSKKLTCGLSTKATIVANELRRLQAEVERLKEDKEFLLDRCAKAGSVSFRKNRDTGVSSNSIVTIAYSRTDIDEQEFPADKSDLDACRRMWSTLPEHRKTKAAKIAMERAEQALKGDKP